jgi:hypothetical protein
MRPGLLKLTILSLSGDVADDRFFHKTNDSDATQFALLFPRIPAHRTCRSHSRFNTLYLWLTRRRAMHSLGGFLDHLPAVLHGWVLSTWDLCFQGAFRLIHYSSCLGSNEGPSRQLTKEEMDAQAGTFATCASRIHSNALHSIATFLPTR